ncbi:MAG TPA: carboxypeptidase-like regulatory domain-containing protein, partial [Pyrinomonadaceae bacterium]
MKRITGVVLLAILPTVVLAGTSSLLDYRNRREESLEQRLDRFVITGQVVDENSQPIPGASVAAHPDSLHGKLPLATTDNQGRFSIRVYKTGVWTITANKPSQGYPTMSPFYYPV